jgi:hypothetical protein
MASKGGTFLAVLDTVERPFIRQLVVIFMFFTAASAESLTDAIKQGDKVVMLGEKEGTEASLLHYHLNFKKAETPDGNCFGLMHLQQLLNSVTFKNPNSQKISHDDIQKNLIKIAKGESASIDFAGFSSLPDLLKEMFKLPDAENPILKAVKEIQQHHIIHLEKGGMARTSYSPLITRDKFDRFQWNATTAKGINQVEDLVQKINTKQPVWVAARENDPEKKLGHAMMVVGYLLSAEEQRQQPPRPHRFIIRDPNSAELQVMTLDANGDFKYDMPQEQGPSKTAKINLAIQSIDSERAKVISEQFDFVEAKSPEAVQIDLTRNLPGNCMRSGAFDDYTKILHLPNL